MKLTVITPTLNPRMDYLRRVFAALDAQSLPKDQWEYLVVDNGSDEPLAGRLDLAWHPNARVVTEPEKGLTRARIKGFDEAANEILVFDDDDVVLDPEYLARVRDYFTRHPFLGVVGGFGPAEYEKTPEKWMEPFLGLVMDERFNPVPKASFQYAMARQGGPWIPNGSALAVRAEIARAYAANVKTDATRIELDRKGRGIVGAGDTDLVFTAVDSGWASGTATDLKFTHLISARRVDARYIERLMYATNYYTARVLVLHGWKKQAPPYKRTLMGVLSVALGLRAVKPWPRRCWIAFNNGYRDGLTASPFDPWYK